MDLNKAMVIGRLNRDPETKTIPSGQTVTTCSVATNFTWNNQEGQKQERVEYHNIVAWRKLAEIMGQYLKKGSKVYIEGRLQTRSWEDQTGQKKYRTEIIADNMIMLDSAGGSRSEAPAPSDDKAPEPSSDEEEINVEDIPF
jgi:single-strand DNA-binding protein